MTTSAEETATFTFNAIHNKENVSPMTATISNTTIHNATLKLNAHSYYHTRYRNISALITNVRI